MFRSVWIGIAAMATIAAAYAAQVVYSGGSAEAGGCGNSSLSGSYGFSISGTAIDPSSGGTEEIIGVAMTQFDGRGGLTQVDNIHGALSGTVTDRSGSGTYQVNPDCSGTMTLNVPGIPFPIQLRIVVVDKGHEVRTAVMGGPNLVTSIGKSAE